MNKSVLQRLKDFIDYKKMTVSAFEKSVGISNGAFASQLKNDKTIGVDKLENILNVYPDLNAEWLFRGLGKMIIDAPNTNLLNEEKTVYLNPQYGVPLVESAAAAGFGNENFTIKEDEVMARYSVPAFENIDFMIPIKGNSMYPKYTSGDIVACRIIRQSKFIRWNEPYIIATREQGMICKRLRKSAKEGHYLAVSENTEYESFDIPIDEITGIALVVGIIRVE